MRRVLSLAAALALLAVSALPAQAHDAATAARLGVEVQAALARAGVVPASAGDAGLRSAHAEARGDADPG